MNIDVATLLAILGMALVTLATRLAGWFAIQRVTITGRTRHALEAVPAAVLAAVIAPTVLATGPAETIAAAITVIASLRLPALATVAVGVLAVVVLRATLG